MPNTKPLSRPVNGTPDWVHAAGDSPDHYHGLNWTHDVMPNNYLFFVRNDPKDMLPAGVTHNLHHRHELVVAYEGSALACVEKQVYRIDPGTALLLAPGTFHYYFAFPPEGFTWLFFTFELGPDTGLVNAAGIPRKLTADDLDLLSHAGQLYTRSELPKPAVFDIALTMGRFIKRLSALPPLKVVNDSDDGQREACTLLRKLTHFVNQRMDQALRIADLAEELGVSESNLRKIFRERYAVSLGAYLRRSRLTRGVQLINHPDMSVSEVARQCGFESIFSFSQAFRRAIGMPPSAYRRHLAEGRPPITPGMLDENETSSE
ncbi:MAG: helix-turn-helix transcriptional regulator [Verrucomicrobiota bacterium]